MTLTGVGTGISELTTLAGTAELVPISRRGYYTAAVILTIIPFMPSVMYAQLIAAWCSWRYITVVTTGLAMVSLTMTFMFYSPPKPTLEINGTRSVQNKIGLVKKTDMLGGALSILGLAGIEVGLLGGGYAVRVGLDPSLECGG